MEGLYESTGPFVEALGRTLIHSVWVGMLLAGMLKFALYMIPSRLARGRYLLAGLTMAIYLISVTVIFFILFADGPSASGSLAALPLPPVLIGSAFHVHAEGAGSVHYFWYGCCALYFSGALFMLLRMLPEVAHLRRIRNSGRRVEDNWEERFGRLLLQLGIRRKVLLQESAMIGVPGVIGLLKPVVLVPVGMLTQLPMEQVETILIHELYHLKRFDFLVNILQMIAEGLFFYNPAIWIISAVMRVEREHSCDDLVLRQNISPMLYARALYQLSDRDLLRGRFAPGAAGPDRPGLLNRIYRILNPNVMKTNIRERIASFIFLASGLAIFTLITGFSSGFSILKPEGTEPLFTIESTGHDPNNSLEEDLQAVPVSPVDTVPGNQKEMLSPEEERSISEAMEEIDWEEMREEITRATSEAMEEIDWEEIRREIDQAASEAMEEIDWEEIRKEIDRATAAAMEEIDWEEMQLQMKKSMEEMKEIDWEQMKRDIRESMEEIDLEKIRKDVEESINEIDWEKMKMDMERIRIELDSLKHDPTGNRDPFQTQSMV